MPDTHEPDPRGATGPETARKTWATLEPLHAMIYFSPEATAAYAELGLTGASGYFASRSAALGAVPAEVVVATFFNFNPALVRTAVPAAWDVTDPATVLAARTRAADATLRRAAGGLLDTPDVARAARLARTAAEAARDDLAGRPLFAAHARLPWPDEPHLVLWHAQTLLREYRGDAHIAALVAAGLSGIEAFVTHEATGDPMPKALRASRGWPEDRWRAAADGLRERGWLADGPDPVLSDDGTRWRAEVERVTDERAAAPYAALGADACAELRALARPLARAVRDNVIVAALASR
ncbi:MAG TPA: hypothetical protein VGL93_30490 [Streptosporangiaceae bacterium]|jgi:hypothetical protein